MRNIFDKTVGEPKFYKHYFAQNVSVSKSSGSMREVINTTKVLGGFG